MRLSKLCVYTEVQVTRVILFCIGNDCLRRTSVLSHAALFLVSNRWRFWFFYDVGNRRVHVRIETVCFRSVSLAFVTKVCCIIRLIE